MLRTITIPKYYLKIIRHLNSLLFPGIIQIETKFFALFIDSLLGLATQIRPKMC